MSTSVTTNYAYNFSIIENIYAIIDSKLQYLEYQTKRLIQVILDLDSTNTIPDNEPIDPQTLQSMMIEDELVLVHIEKTSSIKKMLIILRTQLTNANASLIFKLLSGDEFLKYNEKGLKALLKE